MGQVLVAKYGRSPWILQIMEAVQGAVQRGIEQLGASQAPQANAMPGDIQTQGYAMPARTREDVTPAVIAAPSDIPAPTNQQLVAQGMQEQNNDVFAMLSHAQDPATQQLGHGLPGQALPQPMQDAPISHTGLVLPQGGPPQEVNLERTGPRHDDSDVSWLF